MFDKQHQCDHISAIILCLVAMPCLTLCDSINYSTPYFPVLHYLPEFAQTRLSFKYYKVLKKDKFFITFKVICFIVFKIILQNYFLILHIICNGKI